MQSDWCNSASSPVVYGDIALSFNTQQYNHTVIQGYGAVSNRLIGKTHNTSQCQSLGFWNLLGNFIRREFANLNSKYSQ